MTVLFLRLRYSVHRLQKMEITMIFKTHLIIHQKINKGFFENDSFFSMLAGSRRHVINRTLTMSLFLISSVIDVALWYPPIMVTMPFWEWMPKRCEHESKLHLHCGPPPWWSSATNPWVYGLAMARSYVLTLLAYWQSLKKKKNWLKIDSTNIISHPGLLNVSTYKHN